MQAWQYTTITKTLENSLSLNKIATPPDASSLPKDHVLIEVITAGINPVEYKLPEVTVFGKLMIQPRSSPGLDFCGRIKAKNGADDFPEGQLVFGALSIGTKLPKFGSLGQLMVAPCSHIAPLPTGVKPDDAAALGTAGLTAFQSLPKEHLEPGSKVFINGGSGGVGSFTIQFAKAVGAYVVATCSTANVDLCKRLGADEVIDYRTSDVLAELKAKGPIFDVAIDNVGNPECLYESSPHFLKPDGVFVQVAMQKSMISMLRRSMLPGFLGGGKRRFQTVRVSPSREDLGQIGRWLVEGKVKVLIDEKFEWINAPKAYAKLRLGRTNDREDNCRCWLGMRHKACDDIWQDVSVEV
ncbi:zinc alcohol dehydrogenase [Colletotrichum chrysophilum]|uniref:Zinc alcohol dehydrogenase n=1 Tax=Colletotrichum chrysophilum TaxID=1836956 RepID=A0AAD9EDR8_9PEZI|nr:zinc alcohol dehydrogenase [Colletotrichum chrysophilum]